MFVITTPWPEFRDLAPDALSSSNGKPTILDCWRILPFERFAEIAEITYLGYGPEVGNNS